MEIILYVTGGIGLLALAWLLITLAQTMKVVQKVLAESIDDVHGFTKDFHEMTQQITPVLKNLGELSSRATNIVEGVESQMVSIHATVDDTLDVVRGTIDDVERLKNEVVDLVESPIRAARKTSVGVASTVIKGVTLLAKLFADRSNGNGSERRNGKERKHEAD